MYKIPFQNSQKPETHVTGRYDNYGLVDIPLDSSNENDETENILSPFKKKLSSTFKVKCCGTCIIN